MLFHRDYSKHVVAIFSHQIQSEYYGGNISVSIEGIALENVSALPKSGINAPTKSFTLHAVFHYFFRMTKKNATITTAHIKIFIELFKKY